MLAGNVPSATARDEAVQDLQNEVGRMGHGALPLRDVSPHHHLLAGAVAGLSSVTFAFPFDTCMTWLQNPTSPYRSLRDIFPAGLKREGGWTALYRGVTTPLTSTCLTNSSNFFVYHAACHTLARSQRWKQAVSWAHDYRLRAAIESAAAGCVTGGVLSLIISPRDLIKCRVQLQNQLRPGVIVSDKPGSIGSWQCLKSVVQTEGFLGLYRGFASVLIRDVPGCAVYFGVYRWVREAMKPRDALGNEIGRVSAQGQILAGGSAGVAFWASCYPIDSLRLRVQMYHPAAVVSATNPHPPLRTSFRACLRQVQQSGEWARLYRGFSISVLRSFPVSAVNFGVYEFALSLMQDRDF